MRLPFRHSLSRSTQARWSEPDTEPRFSGPPPRPRIFACRLLTACAHRLAACRNISFSYTLFTASAQVRNPNEIFRPQRAFMTISFPTPAFCSRSDISRDLQCGGTTSRILALGTDAPAGPASHLLRQGSAPPFGSPGLMPQPAGTYPRYGNRRWTVILGRTGWFENGKKGDEESSCTTRKNGPAIGERDDTDHRRLRQSAGHTSRPAAGPGRSSPDLVLPRLATFREPQSRKCRCEWQLFWICRKWQRILP
jgi:hypothetical protein